MMQMHRIIGLQHAERMAYVGQYVLAEQALNEDERNANNFTDRHKIDDNDVGATPYIVIATEIRHLYARYSQSQTDGRLKHNEKYRWVAFGSFAVGFIGQARWQTKQVEYVQVRTNVSQEVHFGQSSVVDWVTMLLSLHEVTCFYLF